MRLEKIKYGWLFLFIFALLLFPCKKAEAANPTKVNLKVNKTYKNYDITGDKKKDSIKIKGRKNFYDVYEKVSVIVNGKECASWKSEDTYDIDAKLYTLKNGKSFLYLWLGSSNDDGIGGVFQYKKGKLKQVIDANTFFGKQGQYAFHSNISVKEVKENSMTVEFYLMSNTLASSTYRYKYVYKGGTLKRSSYYTSNITCYAGSKLTAQKNIKVYKKSDGKKVFFTLKSGQQIKLLGAYVKSGDFFIKVKSLSNGKTGWIKCLKNTPAKPPFREITYAG